ncbi:Phage portal protein, SPP1 Gp6-like (plasmid) [Tsukamurella tyrosinosolvens]|uniref:Phage portal protein, SPP1 Gp6-like n=1 Tax=Tsukamurella tyrosinosolvens TaxID=57704 RepID=A0A1H4WM20_TSUTY|nr:phage portal protein [Tsukamurella tyrosinosolvens]SEC94295.1 Phage portal protein, SPP1 Gp6-like [Tsukamurella tyrosinosolvens]VEH89442.1 Phage portal protein, SPP1 Gp6-like [Tsukamurella tyrosinosolvens]
MTEPTLAELDNALNVRLPQLNRLGKYYAGQQPLSFIAPEARKALGQRFDRYSVNLPRLAVTAIAERLRVQSFRTADGARDTALIAAWRRNDLDQLAPVAHREALAVGEAAVIVWADERGKARVSVESAEQVAVYRDAGSRETIAAIKRWVDKAPDGTDRQTRWVVYYPDRIVHLQGDGASITAAKTLKTVDNPLLAVNVVALTNADRPMDTFGVSEFEDLIPITDGINKLSTDLLTASEYGARPRRWATGLELEEKPVVDDEGNPVLDDDGEPVMEAVNPIGETDKLMINEDSAGKFGQLDGAALDGYENAVSVMLQQAMAVSGLPAHYVGVTTSVPSSAEAIRAAEAGLTAKAEAAQAKFGRAWEAVGRLIHAIEDGGEVDDYAPQIVWSDPATRSVAQEADATVKLHGASIISTAEARERLDIDNPDDTPAPPPADARVSDASKGRTPDATPPKGRVSPATPAAPKQGGDFNPMTAAF